MKLNKTGKTFCLPHFLQTLNLTSLKAGPFQSYMAGIPLQAGTPNLHVVHCLYHKLPVPTISNFIPEGNIFLATEFSRSLLKCLTLGHIFFFLILLITFHVILKLFDGIFSLNSQLLESRIVPKMLY